MGSSPTFSSVNIGFAMNALSKLGYSIEAIQAISETFAERFFGSDEVRLTWEELEAFWKLAADIAGDDNVGLTLGAHYQPNSKSIIASLLMSSLNIEEGMRRLEKYHQIIGDPTMLSLEEHSDFVVINYGTVRPFTLSRSQADYFCMQIVKLTSWILGQDYQPTKIHFAHDKPSSLEPYQNIFKCPILFSKDTNRIYFDKNIARRKSPHANAQIVRALEAVAEAHLSEIQKANLIELVEEKILDNLLTGSITLPEIAAKLDIQTKVLNDAIQRAGLTFSAILNDVRRAQAERLLKDNGHTITAIAILCGYNESSSFVRAFRRWHNMSPRSYRLMQRSQQTSLEI